MNGTANEDLAASLPSAKPYNISSKLIVQPPLTRRGNGPGLILLTPPDIDLNYSPNTLDPPPLQKWAEEGFAVAQITTAEGSADLQGALDSLAKEPKCDSTEKVAVISYNTSISPDTLKAVESSTRIVALVTYGNGVIDCSKPVLGHVVGSPTKAAEGGATKNRTYNYADLGPFFAIPAHDDFRGAPAAVAHTRCLAFLKPLTGGPYFDLEAIWDEHTKLEFEERHVEKTMATMVQEPYVNHIPTMTGGIGRDSLTHFYRHHFIFNNPADTSLDLVSRTVGIDRVIDEFVCSFTHDKMIDWLIPGIPPTGKHVEVPFTSVVNIRGDRLYHEHIGWDQATVLRQLGLLPDYLPFPYALPDGSTPRAGKRFEYRVPTAGIETAKKLVDESAVESNGLFEFAVREVDA